MAFGSIMSISNDSSEFNNAILKITGPKTGSAVTVTQGSTVINAIEDNGVWTAEVGKGSWVVSCNGVTETVVIDNNKVYEIKLLIPDTVLGNNNWTTIKKISSSGNASQYWSIGDTKNIILNGTALGITFNNLSINVFIIGIDHNSRYEGTNKIHFQIGKINNVLVGLFYNSNVYGKGGQMNTTQSNSGGWESSYMRNHSLSNRTTPETPESNSFMSVLPEELRDNMISVRKFTDNRGNAVGTSSAVTATVDYLFLLSPYEVSGNTEGANTYESTAQERYSYYLQGNRWLAYSWDDTTYKIAHWFRSPAGNSAGYFMAYSRYGFNGDNARLSNGICPCFCV